MRKDQNYGHLVEPCIVNIDGVLVKRSEDIELAPAQYGYCVVPDEAVHAEHGNIPIIRTTERVASPGHELVRVGWEERDWAIYGVWEERELPPRIVRYSKRKFVLALATRKLYTRFCEWAESVEAVPGSGLSLSKLLDNSTFMQSDDLNLAAVIDAAKELLGADTVDEILAESEDDE